MCASLLNPLDLNQVVDFTLKSQNLSRLCSACFIVEYFWSCRLTFQNYHPHEQPGLLIQTHWIWLTSWWDVDHLKKQIAFLWICKLQQKSSVTTILLIHRRKHFHMLEKVKWEIFWERFLGKGSGFTAEQQVRPNEVSAKLVTQGRIDQTFDN